MKTALITGAAGFLGSHLCDLLLENGYNVIAVDNLYTGTLQNLKHISSTNFRFIKHDIIQPLKISEEIHEIYNLACPASPPRYQKDPIFTWKTSAFGTYHLLELAVEKGAKFLQASTSEVYGDPNQHPQKESYWGNVNPIGIRSCYDEGKRAAEALLFDFNRTYQVEIKVMRIFNTYGPRMDSNDGRVVSNFIMQAIRGKDISIYGDGSQTRSFCYFSDLIEGMYRLMQSRKDFLGPINIGNPAEFTIKELAEKIIKLTKSQSQLSLHTLPLDDPKQRRPDISKAKKELNWLPEVNLDDGLRQTIDYFESKIQT